MEQTTTPGQGFAGITGAAALRVFGNNSQQQVARLQDLGAIAFSLDGLEPYVTAMSDIVASGNPAVFVEMLWGIDALNAEGYGLRIMRNVRTQSAAIPYMIPTLEFMFCKKSTATQKLPTALLLEGTATIFPNLDTIGGGTFINPADWADAYSASDLAANYSEAKFCYENAGFSTLLQPKLTGDPNVDGVVVPQSMPYICLPIGKSSAAGLPTATDISNLWNANTGGVSQRLWPTYTGLFTTWELPCPWKSSFLTASSIGSNWISERLYGFGFNGTVRMMVPTWYYQATPPLGT